MATFNISGHMVDGHAKLAALSILDARGVPPYPGEAVISAPRPATPPPFDWGLPDERQVQLLARTYASACFAICHRASAIRTSPVTRETGMIINTARPILRGFQVEPFIWILYSLCLWRANVSSTRLPSLKWVFSPSRLESDHAACLTARGDLRYTYRPLSTPHQQLLTKWMAMRRALLALDCPDMESITRVVAEHFPADIYDRLIDSARASCQFTQRQIDNQQLEGEVFWTL